MNVAAQKVQEAGRVCPLDYTYAPEVFARAADFSAETLYVVGGLYGNLAALDAIEAMAAREPTRPEIVFNGDFHWFDAAPDWFAAIEQRVAPFRALRGNVETEIAREGDIGAGCGCAYPDSVAGDIVARSNEILALLQRVTPPAARTRLAQLPMHLVADVGPMRVGIVHGDAAALAGWRFAHDELDNPRRLSWLADIHGKAKVDVFASTHTCLAALRDFALPSGRLTIVNNGAAGMPNFRGDNAGLLTRIAVRAFNGPQRRFGLVRECVHIDAIAVRFDSQHWAQQFLQQWPDGSDAHASYWQRIAHGPAYEPADAFHPPKD